MVNLLFGDTKETYENLMSMKTEPKVIEVVLFEANAGYSKQEVEDALATLNEAVKFYDGFVERTTGNNKDGKYIDIIYWTDMKSAKDAAEDIVNNQKAAKAFEVIKPASVQMFHFDTFNQYQE